jgi:tetratricopeptide (TPR) repeat protein/DNA-binding MarR family transcriptional regulator
MARLVVSQNERIILHLSELDRFRDEPDVPMDVSQEGIAIKLGTQVFSASRALTSLESDGLVTDRLAHVRGAPKRRRAYFLTEKGKSAASRMRSDIAKRRVVIEHAGNSQEMTIDEAARKLMSMLGRTVEFSEIVEKAREFDVVLSSSLIEPTESAQPLKEQVVREHGRPKVVSFFGRERESESLQEAVARNEPVVVLIWGMPGIGKSTLASKTFESLVHSRPLFWHTFREWEPDAVFLSSFSEFLSANGRTSTAHAVKRGVSVMSLFGPLSADLSGSEFVIFLDDLQKPPAEVVQMITVLFEAVRSSGSAKLVLISRSVPEFFSKTEPGNVSIELKGLDRDAAWKFAQSLNASDGVRLVDESHGHPLLLSLMARGGVSQTKGDIISFIEREIYSKLSEKERTALESLSVYRHPVPIEALRGVDYMTVSDLRQKALVVEEEDGIWTHDILREFFISHLSSEAKTRMHDIAGAYCERGSGIEWGLESLYHFTEAGNWRAAARVAVAHADELGKEFPDESLALLSRLDLESLDGALKAELLFVRGQMNESIGHQEAALIDLEESLLLLKSEADAPKRALVLEAVAKLQAQVSRWAESVATHEKALRLYEDSRDMEGQAREWMNIGGVLRKKGDRVKAREAYDQAFRLSTKEEDRPSQAACLNNIGLLDWDEGRLKDAEMRLKESVRLAHAIKDHSGEGRGLENLGNLFQSEGKLGEAANIFLESSEAYRRGGEIEDFKRLMATCAETLGAQGRYTDGIELCEKTLARPELRRRTGLFQRASRFDAGDLLLSSTLIDLLRSAGEHKRALEELSRYARMSETIADPSMIARGSMMRSMVQEDIGDLDSAKKSLVQAERLLASAGSSEGITAVQMRMGIIDEKLGDYASAAVHYGEAARHAELAGDMSALAIARENQENASKGG